MVGAIGLPEADHSLLGRPVQRQVDMRGEFQIGQFSTLGDRLDDFRREKRQADEAGDVAISYALAAGERGQRSRPGRNEFLEPPMGPCNRLEQRSIRLALRCVCASDYEPHKKIKGPDGAMIGVVCFKDPDGAILELISGM